jgi:uncharacterized protein (UPF0332 family)
MSLADDLLVQSRHLLKLDRNRPKQANLRRAVSACYYALFHLLTGESARRLGPASPPTLIPLLQRAYDHAVMRRACHAVLAPESSLNRAFKLEASTDLRMLAEAFQFLQDARHKADYDLSYALTRSDAELYLRVAEAAFQAWRRIRGSDEANVFLVALLLKGEWPRK